MIVGQKEVSSLLPIIDEPKQEISGLVDVGVGRSSEFIKSPFTEVVTAETQTITPASPI